VRKYAASAARNVKSRTMLAAEDVLPLLMADLVYPRSHPLSGTTGPVFAYVIRHPDGAILVDSGIGGAHRGIDAAYKPTRYRLDNALRSLCVEPSSVRCLVNTHLHWDHAGGNSLFPGVTTFVQRSEREAADEPSYTVREFIDFPGSDYALVDGDRLIAEGIWVLATPGHTRGHQSVAVETSSGIVLLAGQVAPSAAAFAALEPEDEDDRQSRESLRRLHRLKPVLAWLSHDSRPWLPR
jgi:glyoxylase-like metal-dependent hydrolase (beta-lactamase superfamily II)